MQDPAAKPESASSAGVRAPRQAGARATYSADELAIVLSHYDTGAISSIQSFPKGSPTSPKCILNCERGLLLLKRRSPAESDPRRVAFSHSVLLHLVRSGFPTARLVGDRRDRNSMVVVRDRIYELFEFVHGAPFDLSAEGARSAGAELGNLHRLVRDVETVGAPPGGPFHTSKSVRAALAAAGRRPEPGIAEQASALDDLYEWASNAADRAGVGGMPAQVVHGDWHPGNLLFDGAGVVAALDFDSSRVEPTVCDLASAALQFSVTRTSGGPEQWPDGPHEPRLAAFLGGYHEASGRTASEGEARAAPPLMMESLIAEGVAPVAATGRFAGLDGGPFLGMIARKARWLRDHADHVVDLVKGGDA